MSYKRKTRPKARFYWVSGGAGGIRTRGGLLTHTRFPGVRLKPLIHRSEACHCNSGKTPFRRPLAILVQGVKPWSRSGFFANL